MSVRWKALREYLKRRQIELLEMHSIARAEGEKAVCTRWWYESYAMEEAVAMMDYIAEMTDEEVEAWRTVN